MSWNEENIRELRRLWDAGYSASAIGKQIGITKNAVIGKAHRLGLKSRPSPIKRGVTKSVIAPVVRKAPPVEAPPMPALRPAPRKTANGPSCLWPIGDPGTAGFHFCGAPSIEGKPYCAEHCAKAYITRSRSESEAA